MSKIDSPRSSLEHIRALCVAYDSTPEVFQRTFRSEVAKAADAGLAALVSPVPLPVAPLPMPMAPPPAAWGSIEDRNGKPMLAVQPKDVHETLVRIRDQAFSGSLIHLLAEAGIGLLKTGCLPPWPVLLEVVNASKALYLSFQRKGAKANMPHASPEYVEFCKAVESLPHSGGTLPAMPIASPPVPPAPATVAELANMLRSILTQPTLTPDLKDQSIDLLKRVPKR